MSVFRIHKTGNFTTVLNDFIQDMDLSIKGKGLLLLMLSLPDDWDYSEKGLEKLTHKDGQTSIRSALKELEEEGYLVRTRVKDEHGRIVDWEYNIYETAQGKKKPKTRSQKDKIPQLENPQLENPQVVSPQVEIPLVENQKQLNTKQVKTNRSNTNQANTIRSNPAADASSGAEPGDGIGEDEIERRRAYKEIILENISYDWLKLQYQGDVERLDELVALLIDTVCTRRRIVRIASDDIPAEAVRSRLLKLNDQHICYVMDSLKENTTQIRNIRQYLLAALYNAPTTMDNYYTARVNHDMANPGA